MIINTSYAVMKLHNTILKIIVKKYYCKYSRLTGIAVSGITRTHHCNALICMTSFPRSLKAPIPNTRVNARRISIELYATRGSSVCKRNASLFLTILLAELISAKLVKAKRTNLRKQRRLSGQKCGGHYQIPKPLEITIIHAPARRLIVNPKQSDR